MPKYLYTTETTIVVSIFVMIFVGISRSYNGGEFFDPDKAIKSGIDGIVVFVFSLLWYGLIFDVSEILRWSTMPLGKVAISMAMIGIILSRIQNLKKNCLRYSS